MNEQNEKWLDEQLKKTIDSGKVNFDSEQWKQKYSAEYEELVSRAEKRPNVPRFLWVRSLVRVAAIVAVIALVLFLIPRLPSKRVEPMVATFVEDRSPVKMLSVLSLSLAYRQGGLDAVDEQCKKASELLGQKNTTISIGELLNENNGQKPERKNL
jgi:anti-sigma-K factor RskA